MLCLEMDFNLMDRVNEWIEKIILKKIIKIVMHGDISCKEYEVQKAEMSLASMNKDNKNK